MVLLLDLGPPVVACATVSSSADDSRRQNVGSLADSEGNGQAENTGKRPFAGKLLEAATRVEPVMEVLQT
jgi:hypothetical protein